MSVSPPSRSESAGARATAAGGSTPPDVAVRRTSGRTELIEIKPEDFTHIDDDELRWEAAAAAASELGWAFRLVSPPPAQKLANLSWLAGYRRPAPSAAGPQLAAVLDTVAAEPMGVPFEVLAEGCGGVAVRPLLYGLLWHAVLRLPLGLPWIDATRVSLGSAALNNLERVWA